MNLWKKRDEYLNNKAYQRDSNRTSYSNGYYERDYTTKIGILTLRVPRTRDGNSGQSYSKGIKEMRKHY